MLVELIRQAIAERIEPGRTGISLSGGLDSSTVACLAPPGQLCFTGFYADAGYDERQYARLAVARGCHSFLTVQITPWDFVRSFEAMCAHVRPPIMGMGTFGQFIVAKHASQYVGVMLSGEGSDELFGGYARQMMVAGELPPEGYENYRLPDDYPRTIEEALDYDLAKLPDLLAVDDQMTGAFGIEARAPFTDQRIVDYALALPARERIGKRHLRTAVRGLVPNEIIDRTDKMGFPIPLVAWAQKDPVRTFIMDRLGYLPDPTKPYDRSWWVELVERQAVLA